MHDQVGGREVSPRNGFPGHLVAAIRVNELRAIEWQIQLGVIIDTIFDSAGHN
jgi:hypothetical protein